LLIILLLSLLLVSILIHIFFLIKYIRTRNEKFLWRFLNTAGANLVIAGLCIVIALYRPEEIKRIQMPMVLWLMSGVMMALVLSFQIVIFIKVYRRAKLPENYHFNYFGKKVYHPSIVKPTEVVVFFSSMPLLLLAGAYFVAKSIRMFI
jgi:drug/metabolite transporter (DMT)-like permease